MPRPLIGITRDNDGSSTAEDAVYANYAQAIEKAGGTPEPVYFSDGDDSITPLLDRCTGLVFSGGDDLDPALFGQARHPQAKAVNPRRQRFEFALLAAAEARRKPVLGICLGAQLLNVYRGGDLLQFLPDVPRDNALEHRKLDVPERMHEASFTGRSLLSSAVGTAPLVVNSSHKQAISRIGRGLVITARAADGVIEAVEDPSFPLFLGVQWHPERLRDQPRHLAIFQLLTRVCSR